MTTPETLISPDDLTAAIENSGKTAEQLDPLFGGQVSAWLDGSKPVPAKYASRLNNLLGTELVGLSGQSDAISKETTQKRRPRRRSA